MTARDDLIKGLRDAADWLEAHPALPDGPYVAHVQYTADLPEQGRAAEIAEVDRIAAGFGMKAGPLFGSDRHYGISKRFGPVDYIIVSIEGEEESR